MIVLTGYGTIRSAVEAVRRGVYDYLAKPFELTELEARVKALLRSGSDLRGLQGADFEQRGGVRHDRLAVPNTRGMGQPRAMGATGQGEGAG